MVMLIKHLYSTSYLLGIMLSPLYISTHNFIVTLWERNYYLSNIFDGETEVAKDKNFYHIHIVS